MSTYSLPWSYPEVLRDFEGVNEDLISRVGLLSLSGSNLYGGATESSDLDLYGFYYPEKAPVLDLEMGYLPKFDQPHTIISMGRIGQKLDGNPPRELILLSVNEFFSLGLGSNGKVVETLAAVGQVNRPNDATILVIKEQELFISCALIDHYAAYSRSQASEAKKLRDRGLDNKKEKATALRTAMYGKDLCLHGKLQITPHRATLRRIRTGGMCDEEYEDLLDCLHGIIGTERNSNDLPEVPDRTKVRNLLVRVIDAFYNDTSRSAVTCETREATGTPSRGHL